MPRIDTPLLRLPRAPLLVFEAGRRGGCRQQGRCGSHGRPGAREQDQVMALRADPLAAAAMDAELVRFMLRT